MVGAMSTTWLNCWRITPSCLMWPGQATTIGLRVPPK